MTEETLFRIDPDTFKINDGKVSFSLYVRDEHVGNLTMTDPQYECFKGSLVNGDIFAATRHIGEVYGLYRNLMKSGWKMLSVERMKFWTKGRFGYEQNINDAGDFSFAEAKTQVDESNIALHDESAKLVGAEELLIYHPTQD